MLKTRLLTAIIGGAILVSAIVWGGIFFNILIALLALIGWNEYFKLFRKLPLRILPSWGSLFILGTTIPLMGGYYGVAFFLGIMIILLMAIRYIFKGESISYSAIQNTLGGIVYVTAGFLSLIVLRDPLIMEKSSFYIGQTYFAQSLVWLLFLCIWASDTFAYFVGRKWGSRHIVPTISPNKTLEGYIGGVIGCIVTSVIGSFLIGLPFTLGIGVGVITSITAPLGDLFESKLKRYVGVKDSGTLLPGHGGVLDRFDSLLFTSPLVLAYVFIM